MPLFLSLWLFICDAYLVIRIHPPAIGGMSFANVDSIEIDLISISSINFVEQPRLGAKWSSREASEDQHDGFTTPLGERHDLS